MSIVLPPQSAYDMALDKVVAEFGLDQTKWADQKWLDLGDVVQPGDLAVAAEQQKLLPSLFPSLGISPATCTKVWERVLEKKEEAYKAMNDNACAYRRNNFRVWSDMARGRISCDVTQISSKIEEIRKVVVAAGGQMWARKKYNALQSEGEYKDDKGKYIDLLVFTYVRMPSKGLTHVAELQIGDKFALDVMANDTKIRQAELDCPKGKSGIPEFWSKNLGVFQGGESFYDHVKAYKLAKANGEAPMYKTGKKDEAEKEIMLPITKKDLIAEAGKLYEKYKQPVPATLQAQLDALSD